MHPTHHDLSTFLAQARPRPLRTMRTFAEEEIVIPDGPYVGRRFRCSRQPYTGLWFDQVDSGRWNRCVATGPTQSGKTLSCFIIPLLYHLFEIQETVRGMLRELWIRWRGLARFGPHPKILRRGRGPPPTSCR